MQNTTNMQNIHSMQNNTRSLGTVVLLQYRHKKYAEYARNTQNKRKNTQRNTHRRIRKEICRTLKLELEDICRMRKEICRLGLGILVRKEICRIRKNLKYAEYASLRNLKYT